MTTGFDTSKGLLFWNKPLLSIGGMWPLETRPIVFYMWMGYGALHLSLMIVDFIQVLGDLNTVLANLTATVFAATIMSKMIVVRFSSKVRNLMRQVAANENEIGYKNEEEREIYMSYTHDGVKSFKILMGITILATTFYYFKKLKMDYKSVQLDETTEFPLPYRICIFFNITESRKYYLAYAYQSPMIYIYCCETIVALFVWSLLIDTCAQLSVLAFRIKNMKSNSETDSCLEFTLREVVQEHKKLIRNSKDIDGAFNIALLAEIVACTVILALCIYNIVVNSDISEATEFVSFFLYIFEMILVIYGYCLVGDLLTQESLNLRDSYYECDWYNMSPRCKRMIIMCMIRTRIPLHITGGGFYIYSVESFTSICKTAMAFGSILRQSI